MAGSFSLASGGTLATVHADKLPPTGTAVSLEAEELNNGSVEPVGGIETTSETETEATFAGVVTSVDESARSYVLSSGVASVPVGVPEGHDLPALADSVTVATDLVRVEPAADEALGDRTRLRATPPRDSVTVAAPDAQEAPCAPEESYPDPPVSAAITLEQKSLQVDFQDYDIADGAAVVQAVCADGLDGIAADAEGDSGDSPALIISADDVRVGGADMSVAAPEGIDLSGFEPGDPIAYELDPNPGEGELLEFGGIASDDGADGADDKEAAQGSFG